MNQDHINFFRTRFCQFGPGFNLFLRSFTLKISEAVKRGQIGGNMVQKLANYKLTRKGSNPQVQKPFEAYSMIYDFNGGVKSCANLLHALHMRVSRNNTCFLIYMHVEAFTRPWKPCTSEKDAYTSHIAFSAQNSIKRGVG